jgi:hypothetical protein
VSRQYCPVIHEDTNRRCERWSDHKGPHRVTIVWGWVERPRGPVEVDDIVDAEVIEERCICDGGAYYSGEQNRARRPFIVNQECEIHGTGAR